uniref:deoxyribose-phosphate aldolase n=1 Tax=Gongylonema pulchrum TaxID=637853 RepID=A0A183DWA1_9BILA
LQAAYVICQAIKQFEIATGKKVGLKVAGGIRTALEALQYRCLVEEMLGDDWLTPALFRIGASSLLDGILQT